MTTTQPRLRLLGFDRPATRTPDEALAQRVLATALGSSAPPANLPTAPPAVPLLASENGTTYTLLPGLANNSPIPWIASSAPPGEEDPISASGAVPLASLTAQRSAPSGAPTPEELVKLVRRAARRLVKKGKAQRANRRKRNSSAASGSGPGSSGSGAPAPDTAPAGPAPDAPSPSSEPSFGDQLKASLPNMAAQQGVSVMANSLAQGTLSPGALASGGLGMLTGVLGSAAMLAVQNMLGLEAPDASDGTEDWAVAVLGPSLAKEIFAMGGSSKYFGTAGPYDAPPLVVGDKDENGDAVGAGEPSVEIEGKPCAREGDAVAGSGAACEFGARDVEVGGATIARIDDPATYGTRSKGTQSPFKKGQHAQQVFIGGPTNNPDPDIPKELQQWAKDAEVKGPDGQPLDASNSDHRFEHDPTAPQREHGGFAFDKELGEWRVWTPDKGWSASLGEHYQAVGLFGMEGLLPQGFLDLGTPEFPGAGAGTSWWIPDTLFGFDMSGYFVPHDWMFDPANPEYSYNPLPIIEVELQSFLSGLTWCPLHVFFQIVYSSVTSTVAFLAWIDALSETIDADLGFPSKSQGKKGKQK